MNSEIRFPPSKQKEDIELLFGAMRFLSSVRGYFEVRTPYFSAGIEGTEAFIATQRASGDSIVLVASGVVFASGAGSSVRQSLELKKGEAGAAGPSLQLQKVNAETAPAAFRGLLAAPRDVSDWSIYYPPILFATTTTNPAIRRAAELLQSGRPDDAESTLAVALTGDDQSLAFAIRSLAAVYRNRRADGLALANQAVAQAPGLSPGQLALSYAHQATGDVEAARRAAEDAVAVNPNDAFAWARLAELALILSDVETGREAANRSLALAETSLGRSMLGFVALAQSRAEAATTEFRRAIELASGSPLPRLGLGLALVSRGATDAGQKEIETAVALDPKRSNLRTWLARAYLAEGDKTRAISQLTLARDLDPDDPTPNLVSAQARFQANNPVGALVDIQSAERKGGARATVRGRAGLAEDQAVRSGALGRLYNTLGFEDLAIVKSAAAVDGDPTNPAARLALSEAFRNRDGAGIARISEFLHHQLLVPPSLAPIQPDLGEDDLALLNPGGLSRIALYEFGRAFDQDGVRFDAAGFVGSQSTFGEQASLKAKSGAWSIGFGQFLSKTDGFRPNNDVEHEVYVLQGKYQTNYGSILTVEARRRQTDAGDRTLEFDLDPDEFRTSTSTNELRLGYSGSPFRNIDVIGFARYADDSFVGAERIFSGFLEVQDDKQAADIQARATYLSHGVSVTSGFSGYRIYNKSGGQNTDKDTYANGYFYATLKAHSGASFTVGLSADYIEGESSKDLSFNPKLSAEIELFDGVTLRGGYFRTVQRDQLLGERLEPSTLSNFNQLGGETSDFFSGLRIKTIAAGLDAKLSDHVFVGGEIVDSRSRFPDAKRSDVFSIRGYANAVLGGNWTASASIEYARRRSDARFMLDRSENISVPVQVSWFSPDGWFARGALTYIRHSFVDLRETPGRGADASVSVDATVGYRFSNGRGIIALEGRNLLDSDIQIQDPIDVSLRQGLTKAAPQFSRSPSVLLTLATTF